MSLCEILMVKAHGGRDSDFRAVQEYYLRWAHSYWEHKEWSSSTVPIPTVETLEWEADQQSEDTDTLIKNFKRTTITFIDPAGIPPEKERQPPE